jgi:hypothetical protein
VSILLIVEVMDWAPATLTHREHKVLMVLAEDCRDETRQTWRAIDSPDMLRRARLARWEMYAVIKALIEKQCLERSVAAAPGRRAKYRILHLAPLQDVAADPRHVTRQGNPDIDVSGISRQRVGDFPTDASGKSRRRPFIPSDPPELPPDPEQVLTQRAGGNGLGPGQDQQREEDQHQHLNGQEALRRLAARQAAEARTLRLAFSSTAPTGTDG